MVVVGIIQRVRIGNRCRGGRVRRIIVFTHEIGSTDDFGSGEAAGFDGGRIVGAVVCHARGAPKIGMGIVNSAIDNADFHSFTGQTKTWRGPGCRCSDKGDAEAQLTLVDMSQSDLLHSGKSAD